MQPQTPPPPSSVDGQIPPVRFPLPRGNVVEFRLKSSVSAEEFELIETLVKTWKAFGGSGADWRASLSRHFRLRPPDTVHLLRMVVTRGGFRPKAVLRSAQAPARSVGG